MKILLTGGAGFIGSHLAEALLKRGDQVDCLDNFNDYYDPAIKRENIKQSLNYSTYQLIEGEILDFELLSRLFDKNNYDAVVHLAARAGVRPSLKEPFLYQEVNIRGTMNLLEMGRIHRIQKFIFASTSSVYGKNKKVPFSEADAVDQPVSPYAATKRAAEIIAYTYHHLYQIAITCLRFFTVYGPRQRPDMAIHKFAELIYSGKSIQMFGDGQSERDYTYVDDIIHGVTQAIDRTAGYKIYNLGESRTTSLIRLIELIEENLNKKAIIQPMPFQPGDVPITYADISLAKSELAYRPGIPVEVGIKRFVEWFLQQKNK
jgi:UDP-glucuronate 4-epimerase